MLRVLSKAWRRWLKAAEILGNIQMVILLSLIYWTLLFPLAVPFRLFADPLALRDPRRARWITRHQVTDILQSMRKQG